VTLRVSRVRDAGEIGRDCSNGCLADCADLDQALARYPRQDTLALFERASSVEDAFRRERLSRFLLLAITKFPNALFEPLKAKLVLGHEKDEKTDLYDD